MTAEEMWKKFVEECDIIETEYDAWAFGDDADTLAELVRRGIKTGTSSAYPLYEIEGEALPEASGYSVILNSKDEAVCIIENTKVYVVPFDEVTPDHAFKEGGFLFPLVDKGGIFHFIAIGDYNFDGINDEEYHILYDEREYSFRYATTADDTVVRSVQTSAIGTGPSLNGTFSFYDPDERVIDLHLDKNNITFKQITVAVSFYDPTLAKNTSFYLLDEGETILHHTIKSDNTLSVVFDAQTCAKWQNNSEKEHITIPIGYVVKDAF